MSYENVKKPDKIAKAGSFISWDSKTPVKLRMENDAPGNYHPILVQTMFRNIVDQCRNDEALTMKRNGAWQTWTYGYAYDRLKKTANPEIFI